MTSLPFFASAFLLSSCFLTVASGMSQATRTPVLVELFTSEGCSSCPPADALLAKLEHDQPVAGAEIIVLGEHVDYWDSLGWRDRFSSHQYTERQGQYSTHFQLSDVYTPQMIVNGQAQFVGNDALSASRAIVRAAHGNPLSLVVADTRVEGKRLSASVSAPSSASPGLRGDLYAAIVSPMETTQVRSGENGGSTLHHVGVVRSLTRVGDLQALQHGSVAFALPNIEQGRAMRLVVFAQAQGSGAILGAVSTAVPGGSREAVASTRETR